MVGERFEGGHGLEVVDETGAMLPFDSIYAEQGAVVFFYPRANTPGTQLYYIFLLILLYFDNHQRLLLLLFD